MAERYQEIQDRGVTVAAVAPGKAAGAQPVIDKIQPPFEVLAAGTDTLAAMGFGRALLGLLQESGWALTGNDGTVTQTRVRRNPGAALDFDHLLESLPPLAE